MEKKTMHNQAQAKYVKKKKEAMTEEQKEAEKLKRKEYMKAYRASKKTVAPVPEPAVIVPPVIKKNLNPNWKKELDKANDPDSKEVKAIRALDEDAIELNINRMKIVLKKIYKIEPSSNLLRVVKATLSGYVLQGDVKFIEKEMPFLKGKVNILEFIKNLKTQYSKINSFTSYANPFIHILSRIDKYKLEYNILSTYTLQMRAEYKEKREDNVVEDKDLNKVLDMNPEFIKKGIEKLETSSLKAMASIYLLQPPRRLEDYNDMLYIDDNSNLDKNTNYLYKKDDDMYFIYNKYKTSKTYGTQRIEINEDIKPHLKKFLTYLKVGEKLFDCDIAKSIKFICKTIFDVDDITVRWIRISYITYRYNANDMSVGNKKEIARLMAHSYNEAQTYYKLVMNE